MPDESVVEEVLEHIWSERERGSDAIEELLEIEEVAESGATFETVKEIEGMGLVQVKNGSVKLTKEGERQAESIVRRHRLAERLLSEVLSVHEDDLEKNACGFEHALSAEVTESICTLLGHPPTCPHGLPIPKGECCKKAEGELKPLLLSLDKLAVGERGRIAFIASSHARLDRLGSLGIVPGSVIKVHQKKPAFVVKIGETTLAMDPEIIKEVYVRTVRG